MPELVQGVVSRTVGVPVSTETVVVPEPGPGEVRVAVRACGVCHTDLHYREGGINHDFPFLLGHEAAGTVESVGDGVDGLVPGDHVAVAWRAPCGGCRSCRRGRPWYCFDSRNAAQPMHDSRSPLTSSASIRSRNRGASVGSVVNAQTVTEPVASNRSSCTIMTGRGWPTYPRPAAAVRISPRLNPRPGPAHR